METMSTFMVTHRDPVISWEKVEQNWAKLAAVQSAKWIRTWYNKRSGIRYCVWQAPSENHLKEIFNSIGSGWEVILEVEETNPDLWGSRWKEHLKAEEKADTRGF